MKARIKFKSKYLVLNECFEAKGFNIFRGLTFYRREKAPIMVFSFKSSLHSFFVFFPFIVLWLDEKDNVVGWRIVKPFSFNIHLKKNYSKIIEIPISRRYHSIVNFIVGERFKKN